jgi:hypothetical protein
VPWIRVGNLPAGKLDADWCKETGALLASNAWRREQTHPDINSNKMGKRRPSIAKRIVLSRVHLKPNQP